MADFAEALKRPFSDIKKLLIYIALSIIPIVNFISMGYLLDVAETSMKKKKDLPEWKDFARFFVEGLKGLIIGVVYMIPVFIIGFILLGAYRGIFAQMDVGLIVQNFAALGTGFIVTMLLTILIAYFSLGAIMRYIKFRKIEEAFKFKEISKKVFTKTYFVAWFIGLIIFALISALFSLIPVIGSIIGSAIGGIFYFSVLGEAYAKA